ncbi:hypothetical protein [Caudoviricetes sp.]|nr:hypothetical protein [Caudoviricetes sp.]
MAHRKDDGIISTSLGGGDYSNKVSHGYTASVGSSRQIPLKKELCIQVKPFFLRLLCTIINSILVTTLVTLDI